MRYAPLLLAVAAFSLVPALGFAADVVAPAPVVGKTFSDAQRAEIEDIVKGYLTERHPEVIMEAMKELQKRDQSDSDVKSKEAISTSKDKIFHDPTSPVGGNVKGDVIVVEFFDYQCGYCKSSESSVEKLLKEDKNVKLIYKDFPILGPASVEAAKAALASVSQGKYVKFHDALMNKKDHFSGEMIYDIAKDVGLDIVKLKKDMQDDAITKIIEANIKLGSDIGVRGTPLFIIGDQVYPGAVPYEQMKKAIEDTRAAAKK